jgi:hypothetical protein
MTRLVFSRRCAAAWLSWVALAQLAVAEEHAPFRTRNLSPLISIFGMPVWELPARGTEVGITTELANHYPLSQRGPEMMILDGETWRTGLHVRHGFGEGWSVGLELPYYQQSGGVLDDLIDTWHSAFGLPDGRRNARDQNQLLFLLESAPTSRFFVLDRRARGLGDAQLSLGRELGRDGGFLLKGTLKLPTGDEDLLAGSGSADFALTLLRSKPASLRRMPAAYFWGVGALGMGGAERIEFDSRSAALLGTLGGSLRPWPKLGFKAQIDFHSPLYDSRLGELKDPGVQGTLGGWWQIAERGVLEVAVNEDLSVSTSPDLVLHLQLRWTL